jgi:hypothetical protein
MARISRNELIRLQKKFKTDANIGAKFCISRQAVHQMRKKYGIDSRIAGNPARNRKIARLRAAGKRVEKIASLFDLSIPQTYRIIKDMPGGRKKKKLPCLP